MSLDAGLVDDLAFCVMVLRGLMKVWARSELKGGCDMKWGGGRVRVRGVRAMVSMRVMVVVEESKGTQMYKYGQSNESAQECHSVTVTIAGKG